MNYEFLYFYINMMFNKEKNVTFALMRITIGE